MHSERREYQHLQSEKTGNANHYNMNKRNRNNYRIKAVLFLLLAVAGVAGAQTIDDYHTKEWYYGFSDHEIWTSRYFYQHLITVGDTLIMGKKCTIIKQADDYGPIFYASDFYYVNMGKQTFYLHREPNKLLWYNEEMGDFTTLHDYSSQAGDSWTIQVDSCSFDVVVDSTNVVFFGGKNHRVLYVHDSVYETSYFPYYEGCIIEDVGHTKHFFPIEIYWLCHNSFLCGTPEMTGLRCVLEDGDILYHQGEVDCDSVYSSNIGIMESIESQKFTVFPIPSKDILNISCSKNVLIENASYKIINSQGIILGSGFFNHSECISVNNLPSGLYLLVISSPTMNNIFLKFIKN